MSNPNKSLVIVYLDDKVWKYFTDVLSEEKTNILYVFFMHSLYSQSHSDTFPRHANHHMCDTFLQKGYPFPSYLH